MNIIPVKNTLSWSAVVFCACEITQLFCVVFFVFNAQHKFDFRLVISGTLNKWHFSGEKVLQWYRHVFLIGFICFPWPSSQVTIPTMWRPTAFSWVWDCGLALFTFLNYWNPFCSLIRRLRYSFGLKIEGSENLVTVNLFHFVFP